MALTSTADHARLSNGFQWAGYLLGFSVGGFFDGILLHQILQWHHLLSGVEQARLDIRVLVLWDGLFHALMYVIAGFGLWWLWRTRREFGGPGADRRLFANALVGFGTWHVVDSVLSHWLLGIHRIRMDVDNPLFWDLLWFGLFGLVPLAIGLMLQRKADRSRKVTSSPLALVLATVLAGTTAALPPPDQTQLVVLFRPGVSETDAVSAIAAIGGRVIGGDGTGQLWAIDAHAAQSPSDLYRFGAIMVSNSLLPLGCFDWFRA